MPYSHHGTALLSQNPWPLRTYTNGGYLIPPHPHLFPVDAQGASDTPYEYPSEQNVPISPYLSPPQTQYTDSPLATTSTYSWKMPLLPEQRNEVPAALATTRQDRHPLVKKYFQNVSQEKERTLLIQVVNSDWLAAHEEEPQYMGRSILVGFLRRDASGLRCSFDECEKAFDRQDRAVAHIRRHHLNYRPFACGGACGTHGW